VCSTPGLDNTHRKVLIGGTGHRGRAGAVQREYRRDAASGALTTELDMPVSTKAKPILETTVPRRAAPRSHCAELSAVNSQSNERWTTQPWT
jgi:hypothetical protein